MLKSFKFTAIALFYSYFASAQYDYKFYPEGGYTLVNIGGSPGYGNIICDGFFGMIDSNGIEVIPTIYQGLSYFYEGLAAAKMDGKYGFVNLYNEVVIPFKYDYALDFQKNGLAQINIGMVEESGGHCSTASIINYGKYGVIDKKGNEIIPPVYNKIITFSELYFLLDSTNNISFYNIFTRVLSPTEYQYVNGLHSAGIVIVQVQNKLGMIDSNGRAVLPCQFISIESLSYSDSIFSVSKKDTESEQTMEEWSLVNMSGTTITTKTYNYISDENYPHFCAVCVECTQNMEGIYTGGKWSVLNVMTGEEIFPLTFEKLKISYGFVFASLNGLYGCYTLDGQQIIPHEYSEIHGHHLGSLILVKGGIKTESGEISGGKYGLLSPSGIIIDPIYDDCKFFSEGLAAVKLNGKWGYIDETGKIVIPIQFDTADYFSQGSVTVSSGGKEYRIDPTGKKIE